jgi:hypothetical protein
MLAMISNLYLRLLCALSLLSADHPSGTWLSTYDKYKMAVEQLNLEAIFVHSIPSLFRQAERYLQNDNINVLEYMERRLDDHVYVIRAVYIFY